MSNQNEIPISEIGELVTGGTPSSEVSEYWGEQYAWITPADLSRLKGIRFSKTQRNLSEKGLKNSSASLVPPNSIVISTRAPIGYVGIGDIEFSCNQGCKILVPKSDMDSVFLAYSLLFYKNRLLRFGEGTTFQELSRKALERITLPVPKYDIQRKIAHILSTVDRQIEKTEQLIKKYEMVKEGMMQDLFTRGIDVKTGKLRPTYEEAPGMFKQSELGWIPKEWEVRNLSATGKVVTGNTPPTNNPSYYDGEYMFLSPADFNNSKVIASSEKSLSKKGFSISRSIPGNSICVVCIGSTIGKIGITDRMCTTNQQINSLLPNDYSLATLLYYAMRYYLPIQLSIEAGLQAVPIVNKSVFERLLIALATNKQEIQHIQDKLAVIDLSIQQNRLDMNKLNLIKIGLMQDLLTGKVEPPAH